MGELCEQWYWRGRAYKGQIATWSGLDKNEKNRGKKGCLKKMMMIWMMNLQLKTYLTAPPAILNSYPCLVNISASLISWGVKQAWNSGESNFMVPLPWINRTGPLRGLNGRRFKGFDHHGVSLLLAARIWQSTLAVDWKTVSWN